MMHKYILFGLITAVFLPAFVNGAEYKPATILIVNRNEGFVRLVTSIAGNTFNVKTINALEMSPGFLRNVDYVLVTRITAGGFQEAAIEQVLNKSGLSQFANKAFILLGYGSEHLDRLRFSQQFKKLFKGGTFILELSTKDRIDFESSFDYCEFQKFLKNLTTEFLSGRLKTLPEQRAPASEALRQKLNAFYFKLKKLNPDIALEYLDLITQLQGQ